MSPGETDQKRGRDSNPPSMILMNDKSYFETKVQVPRTTVYKCNFNENGLIQSATWAVCPPRVLNYRN